jgi:hypothetical protein
MVDLPLKVKYSGDDARRGLNELKGQASSTATAIKGIFAAAAAGAAVKGLWDKYIGFESDQRNTEKLERSLRRLNATEEQRLEALRLIDHATLKLGANEEITATALTSLIIKTGDAESALRNFHVAQDLAAKVGLSLSTSVTLLAKTMVGQFDGVGRQLPLFKKWADAHKELEYTAEGATRAVSFLGRMVSGEAEATSSLNQIERVNNIFTEMKDEVGRILTGSQDTKTTWTEIGDELERVFKAMQKIKGLPVVQTVGGTVRLMMGSKDAWGDLNEDAYNAMTRNGQGWGGGLPGWGAQPSGPSWTQSIYGPLLPEGVSDWAGPIWDGQEDATGGRRKKRKKKKRKAGSAPEPYLGTRDWAGPELPESTWDYRGAAFGSMPEGGKDIDEFMALMERAQQDMAATSEAAAKARAKSVAEEAQRWQEYQSKIQEVQGALQAGFMAAFSNIGKGFDDMLGSMAKSFANSFISSLIGRLAGKAAGALVGAYSGSGVGPGNFIDSGTGIEIDPSGMRPTTYGLQAAQRANYVRRASRW